jgi:ribose transport system ATP-binding protein
MMVGRQLTDQYPKVSAPVGDVALQVENLSVRGVLDDLNCEVRKGEVLGIFGLMGAGQEEFARAVFGLIPITSGRVMVNGREITIRQPSDAILNGLGLLTRDRREGLVPVQPIPPNITLANVSQLPYSSRLRLGLEQETARKYAQELRITPPILTGP